MADGNPQDVDMKKEDPESGESEEEEEDEEAKKEARVKELDQVLRSDPSDYQAHVDRIGLLKELAELDRLRAAREDFSSAYPLSPELWLQWIEDEKGLVVTDADKERVFSLFDRAARDYSSVQVWLEHCQFALGGLGSEAGAAKAREVFERAVAEVGLHVSKGALVWEAYREFESAMASLAASEEAKKKQKDKVDKLFRRQLTVPLLGMEVTMEEYREWRAGREPEKAATDAYRAAKKQLDEREDFETRLAQSEEDEDKRLEVYNEYVAFEMKVALPARIRSLCERRITDHCLVPSAWSEYLRYLEKTFSDPLVSLATYKRAVRNCPWSADVWVDYLRHLERNEHPQKEAVAAFESALQGGITGEHALRVWMAFLDLKRRQMKYDNYGDEEEDKKEQERGEMRSLFGKAVEHLATLGADPECRVARYWASLEGDRFRAMDRARSLWADVVANEVVGQQAKFWTEYIHLEKALGDTKHLRKLFPKALERCRDWPETVGELWLQFEREEGTLKSMEEAETKLEKKMEKVRAARDREKNREAEEAKRREEKVEKKKERDKEKRREFRRDRAEAKREGLKRKAEEKESGFKMPGEPVFKKPILPTDSGATAMAAPSPDFKSDVRPPPGFKGEVKPPPGFKGDVKPPPGFKGNVKPPPGLKQQQQQEESDGGKPKTDGAQGEEDPEKNARMVFLSNIDFGAGKDDIQQFMSSSGKVLEVRLVKGDDGKSRGFAYVEFSSEAEAKAALVRDREPLSGRPLFISEMNKKGFQFKYGTGLEEKKLFVSKLPRTITSEKIQRVFGKFGSIVALRLPELRDGTPKGIAFVEYEEARSAKAAVQGADGAIIDGRIISVAISNPPPRKQQQQQGGGGGGAGAFAAGRGRGTGEAPDPSSSLGAGTRDPGGGGRKSRVQVPLVPRSLQVRPLPQAAGAPLVANSSKAANGNTANGKEKRSNDDFRNMLLGKK